MTVPHPEQDRALELHRQITEALRKHRTTELALARLLRQMADEHLYGWFGYGSARDYACERLELEPRKARELLLLGRRLPDLPRVEAAMEAGELPWSKARELARVATPETEAAWLDRALAVSCRVLEHEVAAAELGEGPPTGEPAKPKRPARSRLVFEMTTEEADLLRAAITRVRHRTGPETAELGDGAILADLARRVLLEDEGAATSPERYTVVLQQCPDCGLAEGEDAEVTEAQVAEAACDAIQVDMQPGPHQGRRSRRIAPRVRRLVMARHEHRCAVPGCSNRLWLDLHHVDHFAGGGSHDAENLVVLCTAHHRLHHEGRLAIERVRPGRLRFAFADGRAVLVDVNDPEHRRKMPHVGQQASAAQAAGRAEHPAMTHVGDGAQPLAPPALTHVGDGPNPWPGATSGDPRG